MRADKIYASQKQGNYYIFFFFCLGEVLFKGRTSIAKMFVTLPSLTGLPQAPYKATKNPEFSLFTALESSNKLMGYECLLPSNIIWHYIIY